MINVMEDGLTAYDDETDQWYRFDTVEEMQQHVQSQLVPVEKVSTQVSNSVEVVTLSVTIPASTPAGWTSRPTVLIGGDPNRKRITITSYDSSFDSMLLVGSKESILANNGFAIQNGSSTTFRVNCELWFMVYSTQGIARNVIVSALAERLT